MDLVGKIEEGSFKGGKAGKVSSSAIPLSVPLCNYGLSGSSVHRCKFLFSAFDFHPETPAKSTGETCNSTNSENET